MSPQPGKYSPVLDIAAALHPASRRVHDPEFTAPVDEPVDTCRQPFLTWGNLVAGSKVFGIKSFGLRPSPSRSRPVNRDYVDEVFARNSEISSDWADVRQDMASESAAIIDSIDETLEMLAIALRETRLS